MKLSLIKQNRNPTIDRRLNKNLITLLIIFSFLMLPDASSGAAVVYRWIPSSGTAVAEGLTTNWGACDARPSTYVTTILTNAGTSGCASDRHGSAALDPAVDMFFNTAYSQATSVQGNWYFGRLRDSSTGGGTFTFKLIYVYPNGTKAVLPGSASQSLSSGQSADFNVSLAGISGTVPAGAKLGLRVSKSGSSTSLRLYLGDTANNAGTGPSGYFSVTETAGSSNTYNVNLKSSPASSSIAAGANFTYTIYVNNTGNTNGNYTLSVSDSDSSNFITPSILGRSAIYVPKGGSNTTTLRVTAKSSGAGGAIDYTSISVVSVENPSYSNSTTSATTIQAAPSPAVSVSLTPSSAVVNKGGQAQYTVAVTNTGNIPDSYALSLNNGNTTNFSYSLTHMSTGTLNPNASFNTIMTVTASAAAPTGASHTQSVRATGNATGNSGIVTTTVAGGGKIIVATNRFVVLDDPLMSGKTAQTPEFALAPGTGWNLNSWSGAQTTIKSYALVLSEAGTPVRNSPVVFTVRNWNSADKTTSTAINTDANGIASYSIDLNAKNYYGRWYVDANATAIGKNDTTGFIYNWWGCNAGGCRNHVSDSPGAAAPSKQNSPYTLGREDVTSMSSDHRTSDNDCVGCHRGYGGAGGGSSFTGQAAKTADVHTTNTCATCHNITISTHQTDAKIRSCSDCHSWANLTREYTMSGTTPSLSNYSGNVAAVGHNPNSTIPCIICHGSFHNITKPDESLRFTKNSIVEDSQCLTCHTTYSKHNGGVGCTLCHSQDVHDIKVFSQSANYVYKGNSYQGNCTSCHQNSTFINSLKLAQKAGAYSGPDPARVKNPLNHSSDKGGQKWGNYWNSSENACKYCHGSTQHNVTAIGAAVLAALGIDRVGDPIGAGTVCSSCHNSSDSNYMAINSLSVPPPAIIPGINYNNSGMDHTGFITDADCKNCHGSNLTAGDNMSMFTHNVAPASGTCDSCHKEPPDGVLRYNTQGAHTLHAAKGYGNVPITGCDYCHATEGAHESGHPNAFDNANVTTNASASIGTYVINSATGKDDTCSNVSCHSIGLSSGARLGLAIWDSTAAGACNVCHSTVPNGLPPTGNHTIHYNQEKYRCAECHGTNADAGTQTGHKTNAMIDINFTNVTGSINASKTCTVYCHSPNNRDPKPEPTWGVSKVGCGDCHSIPPAVTRNNAAHPTSPECDVCHGTGAVNGTHSGHIDGLITVQSSSLCTGCHNQVTSADLGLHSRFNGTSEADSGDCTTCHFGSIPMVKDAVNNNNTYFCADCHTAAGTGPNKSNIIFSDKKHGVALCLDCHAADGTYHQNDPRGTVANSTYVSRFYTVKNYTDCADCHYSSNLDDAPFNAPGGGEHIGSFGGTCEGGCHNPLPAKTYIQAMHNTSVIDNAETPIISTPVLNPSTVNQGANVNVTAVVTITNGLTATAFVDGAQYRIMSGQNEIVPWTPMAANDGNFSGLIETASAIINTSIPAGTYTVEVRGMGGGPSRNRLTRYYPMNGDVSPVQGATLTIT